MTKSYVPVSNFLQGEIKKHGIKSEYIIDLIYMEQVYLTNKYFLPFGKNYTKYTHSTHYPYFSGIKIDKLRMLYEEEYQIIFKELK